MNLRSARNTLSVALRLVVIAGCLLAIVACNRGYKPKACEKPREYNQQTSIPPLDVPDDLDAPDPAASVQIPEIPGDQGPPPEDSPCLENPPDYFDTSPI